MFVPISPTFMWLSGTALHETLRKINGFLEEHSCMCWAECEAERERKGLMPAILERLFLELYILETLPCIVDGTVGAAIMVTIATLAWVSQS